MTPGFGDRARTHKKHAGIMNVERILLLVPLECSISFAWRRHI
jgi:hypothetical protein